jgi:hypothetical protein
MCQQSQLLMLENLRQAINILFIFIPTICGCVVNLNIFIFNIYIYIYIYVRFIKLSSG